jgi:hypothetical protein
MCQAIEPIVLVMRRDITRIRLHQQTAYGNLLIPSFILLAILRRNLVKIGEDFDNFRLKSFTRASFLPDALRQASAEANNHYYRRWPTETC